MRQTAHFILGSALRAEIFQNRIKIKQNGCSPAGEQEVGTLRVEIIQKLRSKLIKNYLDVRLTAHFILESPYGEKSYKIESKSNRMAAHLRVSNRRARFAWNLFKN